MQGRQTLSGRYSMFFVRVAMRQGLIVVKYVYVNTGGNDKLNY